MTRPIIVTIPAVPRVTKAPAIAPFRTTALSGDIVFDYSVHNGRHILGEGRLLFEMTWAKCGRESIYLLNDPDSIQGVAIAHDVRSIEDIADAASYNFTSRAHAPRRGEIVVLRNVHGHYAAVQILQIKDATRGDAGDELQIRYVIQANRSASFGSKDTITKLSDPERTFIPVGAIPAVFTDRVAVLLVCANPRGTAPLRLGAEERALREAIRLATHRDRFDLEVLHAATIDDMRRALLRGYWKIVHFSGHATANGLQFEDAAGNLIEPDSLALGELLQQRGVKTVVLNACGSLDVALAGTTRLEHTIAMKGPIEDDSAIEFTRGFYDALGAGLPIDEAFVEGMLCCKLKKLAVDAALLRRGDAQRAIGA